MGLIPPVQSALSHFQVQPVKAMCWKTLISSLYRKHLALIPTGLNITWWVSVTVRSNTCVGRDCLMTTYVTVFPYSYKCHSNSVRYTSCATSESTRNADAEMLQGCVKLTLRGLLGVNVHVLRMSQQADSLLLLPLFCHLKTTEKTDLKKNKQRRNIHLYLY